MTMAHQSVVVDVRQTFDLLDRNNDGKISRSEFQHGLWHANVVHSHTVYGYQTSCAFPALNGYLPTSVVSFQPLQQLHYPDLPIMYQTSFEVQTYEARQQELQRGRKKTKHCCAQHPQYQHGNL